MSTMNDSNNSSRPTHSVLTQSPIPMDGAIVLERFPLAYSPGTSTQINHDRLPTPQETRDMSLAFRRDPFPHQRNAAFFQLFAWIPLGLFILLLGCLALTRLLPFQFGIGLAGLASFVGLIWFARARALTPRWIAVALAVPALAVTVAYGISEIIHNRIAITIALAVPTAIIFLWRASRPLDFASEWIFTHPRLRPETRKRERGQLKLRPSWWVPVTCIAIAVVLPRYSTAAAMLAIIAVCLVACLRNRPWSLRLTEARELFGRYLTYGTDDAGAPGVWSPRESPLARRLTMYLLLGSLFFTFGTGLTLYLPWDIARSAFMRMVVYDVVSVKQLHRVFPSAQPIHPHSAPVPLSTQVRRPGLRPLQDDDERTLRLARELQAAALAAEAEDTRYRSQYVHNYITPYWRDVIGDRPYSWFFGMIAAAVNGRVLALWSLPVAFLFALLIPNLVLLATYHRALSALAIAWRRTASHDGYDSQPERTEWEWYVDRIAPSEHAATDPVLGTTIREQYHLFLGVEPHAAFPVLLNRALLNQHAYIVGQTGSGKTSLGLMPLLIQVLRADRDRPNCGEGPPIVVLDLKGDPALFHTVRLEAEARRTRLGAEGDDDPRSAFVYFTPEPNRSSFFFNPFRSMDSAHRSPMQLCELVLDSLGLSHGEGYGRSYYTRLNRMLLLEALKHPSRPRSFNKLYTVLDQIVKSEGKRGDSQTLFELAATIKSLSGYTRLATDDRDLPPHRTIHLPRVLEHGQVAYFWLPAATESVSVREIGKLALYSLLTAAIDRQRDGAEPREIYVVIDEFQRLAGENFRVILEQARSFGIRVILANQSISDLKTPDTDLRPTIRTNTRVKMHFSVNDPSEADDLIAMSGDELFESNSHNLTLPSSYYVGGLRGDHNVLSQGVNWHVTGRTDSFGLKPRLMKNDVITASDHPLEFILHISQGSGYTQFGGVPLPVRTLWPISAQDFAERSSMPWPTLDPAAEDPEPAQDRPPQAIDKDARAEFIKRHRETATAVTEALWKLLKPLEGTAEEEPQ